MDNSFIKADEKLDEEYRKKRAKNKKFCILTSACNYARYMKDWKNSIIYQDYRPLEVIMVDDLSEDNTSDLASNVEKDFSKNDIDFTYYRNTKKRRGCANSYKKAMKLSTSNYFGILDADDMLARDAVEYVMNLYINSYRVDYIWTQFSWCTNKMKYRRKGFNCSPKPKRSILKSELSNHTRHCYSHWRTCAAVPDLMSIWKKNLRASVDKYMGYRLEELGYGMFVDKECYLYRGQSSDNNITQQGTQIRIWKELRNEFTKNRSKYNTRTYPVINYKP